MLKNKIIESYYNEISCDKDVAEYLNLHKKRYPERFLFKIGKVVNLSKLKYKLFFLCCILYEKIWWLLYVYIIGRFVMSSFIRSCSNGVLENARVGFTESEKTSYDFSLTGVTSITEVPLTYKGLSEFCSFKDKSRALLLALRVVYQVQVSRKKKSKLVFSSFKLHLNDVYKVSMYTVLLEKLKSHSMSILLNSHYERWTYLASQIAGEKLTLVQHGRLKEGIAFDYKLGIVNQLYCYSSKSYEAYLSYYSKIQSYQYIKPQLKLEHIGDRSKKIIFMASSVVAVNKELAFIKELLAESRSLDIVVYVKLHPLYDYAHQYEEFASDVVFIDKKIYPYADYMITYNSSLGDEYLALGQKVLFLEEYKDIEKGVKLVLESLIEDK
ncbi:hypothetical protein [Cysteiniphilum halobium]|uniref:hypothetical protein n=1 Tax=Cysteiniphilum halobium TaxID=2219059 RepID=UPI003F86B66E